MDKHVIFHSDVNLPEGIPICWYPIVRTPIISPIISTCFLVKHSLLMVNPQQIPVKIRYIYITVLFWGVYHHLHKFAAYPITYHNISIFNSNIQEINEI